MTADSPMNDPRAELRLIAALMGEASDLEREQLEELLSANPQLVETQARLAEVHELLGEVGEGDFPGELVSSDQDSSELPEWQLPEAKREDLLQKLSGTAAVSTPGAAMPSAAQKSFGRRAMMFVGLGVAACILISLFMLPLSFRNFEVAAIQIAEERVSDQAVAATDAEAAFFQPPATGAIAPNVAYVEPTPASPPLARFESGDAEGQLEQLGKALEFEGSLAGKAENTSKRSISDALFSAESLLKREAANDPASTQGLFFNKNFAGENPALADAYGVFGGVAQPSGGQAFQSGQIADKDFGRDWERDSRIDPAVETRRAFQTQEQNLPGAAQSWSYKGLQRGRSGPAQKQRQLQLGQELSREAETRYGSVPLAVVPPAPSTQTYSIEPEVLKLQAAPQPDSTLLGLGTVAGQTLPSPYYLLDDAQDSPGVPANEPTSPQSGSPQDGAVPGAAPRAVPGESAEKLGRFQDSMSRGARVKPRHDSDFIAVPELMDGAIAQRGGRASGSENDKGLNQSGGFGGARFRGSMGGRSNTDSRDKLEAEVEPAPDFFEDELSDLASEAVVPAKPNSRPGIEGKNDDGISLGLFGVTPAIIIDEEEEALLKSPSPRRIERQPELPLDVGGDGLGGMIDRDMIARDFAVPNTANPTANKKSSAGRPFGAVPRNGVVGGVAILPEGTTEAEKEVAKKLSELTAGIDAKKAGQDSGVLVPPAEGLWFDFSDKSGESDSYGEIEELAEIEASLEQESLGGEPTIELSRKNKQLRDEMNALSAAGRSSEDNRFYFREQMKRESVRERLTPSRVTPNLVETSVKEEAFSTFSLHVSDVSFKLAAESLAKGEWPEAQKVRTEEFVNALDYRDQSPNRSQKVACNIEQMRHPFLQQRNLLRVSLKTAEIGRMLQTPLRLTLLIDNSGSMERPDRRTTLLRALDALFKQLTEQDRVTILLFANDGRLLAEDVTASNANEALQLIQNAPSEGGTNIEQAIRLGFEKARQQQLEGAQNRVVLFTDGAVNLGDANPERLSQYVETMRASGISFDATGICARDLNDEVLEGLTRKGDGRYYLLDANEDVASSFAQQLAGAFRPAAKNVKVQVEFNSQRVRTYKLLGFEKHRLAKEDFRNDAVDAAELAAAEAGVAVYRFEPIPDGSGDVGSVSVRFLDMTSGRMVEKRWPIPYEYNAPNPEDAAWTMKLAAVSALFAERLGGGPLSDLIEFDELERILAALPAEKKKEASVAQLRTMIEVARNIEQ